MEPPFGNNIVRGFRFIGFFLNGSIRLELDLNAEWRIKVKVVAKRQRCQTAPIPRAANVIPIWFTVM